MTPHEVVRPSKRIPAGKAAAFAIVSLLLLFASAQGETFAACGDGVIDAGEACDLGSGVNGTAGVCCSASCAFEVFTVCRASSDVCDPAEQCTGASDTCPVDSFESSTTVCRPAAGVCDIAEQCTGASPSCPDDAFDFGSICRPGVDVCDIPEQCSGVNPSCPDDGFASPAILCRPAMGDCDVSESCTGSDASCPIDAFSPSTTICRFGNDPSCDMNESCTGSDPFCPPDGFQPDGTSCPSDGSFCTGVEACMNGFCQGNPPSCDDNDPCTLDFCEDFDDEGQQLGCVNFPTADQETAAGADGACDTTDDNLSLYGVDQECGTADDLTGDGLCSGQDNCDFDYNPTQQDADNDSQGNACDFTPCPFQGLFVTGMGELFLVDPSTGEVSTVLVPFPSELTDVAVNASGIYAAVTSSSTGMVSIIQLNDLSSGPIDIPLNNPWGVDFGNSGFVYVVEQTTGTLARVDLGGAAHPPVTTVLSGPAGLDVNAAETFAFVTEPFSGALRRVNIATGSVSTVTTGLSTPQGIILDASESNAYVLESGSGELTRVNFSGGSSTVVATGLGDARGVALDSTETYAYVTSLSFQELLQVELSTGNVTPLPFPLAMGSGVALGPSAPTRITLQEGVSTTSSTTRPILVDDLTGLGVLSVDLSVRFNPDVVSVTAVDPGSIIAGVAGCTLTTNLAVPGAAFISIFCTSPMSGAGSLALVTYSAVGTAGQGTPLEMVSSLLNEGDPPHCADEGTFYVPVAISGEIVYYRNHLTGTEPSTKPVEGVDVGLYESFFPDGETFPPSIDITLTECFGDYSFPSLAPIEPYVVVPRKFNDFLGAIDPFDASLNAQHVVGLTSLTTNQRMAADASGNGSLTSFDSARIAQLSVGLIAQLPVAVNNGSDWAFIPTPQPEPNQGVIPPFPPAGELGRIEYLPLVESAENQDFVGILFGDVSGNWQGACSSALPPGGGTADAAMAPGPGGSLAGVATQTAGATGPALLVSSVTASKGQIVRVPIRARELPAAVSFYVDLRYDPSVVRLVRIENGAATASRFSLTPNTLEPGRARVALFSSTQLGGSSSSEIAAAVFEVMGAAGTSSRVAVAGWTVNEGRLPASVSEGNIRVLSLRNPPLK